MKISKLFHWLYASIMFLPLLVAPLFAIYSHRHTIDNYQVEYAQNEVVDFNQKFTFEQNFSYENGNLDVDTTSFHFEYVSNNNENDKVVYANSGDININDILIVKFEYISNINFRFQGIYESSELLSSNDYTLYQNRGTLLDGYSSYYWYNYDNISSSWILDVKNVQTFNLTQMFGAGNEPTLQEFNNYFPNAYYEYTTSKKILLKNVDTITYNDTDIGSQFTYQMYNITDKYLNFDNVLNLGAINDWLLLNVFNGNAPLYWTIIWHFLEYWLLVSIFWLCFDVLIYVPQLAHRWLDKASLE